MNIYTCINVKSNKIKDTVEMIEYNKKKYNKIKILFYQIKKIYC